MAIQADQTKLVMDWNNVPIVVPKIMDQVYPLESAPGAGLMFRLHWKLESLSNGKEDFKTFEEAKRRKEELCANASKLKVLHLLQVRIEVLEV